MFKVGTFFLESKEVFNILYLTFQRFIFQESFCFALRCPALHAFTEVVGAGCRRCSSFNSLCLSLGIPGSARARAAHVHPHHD